ncbi:SDR family NAD(P)-dependent oxidoreductase [Mucilaginibacter sp. UYCu711]|uniref:SDR family NAD(P)-dependent oxidoreductase n=1 Tax=Mucilaginibacter sp. UYCu711 TaxID=3156339 RepID=UPI003D203A26
MIILITGGASGLGKAITLGLAQDPLNTVYFTYHSSDKAAKEIETVQPNTHAIKYDLSNKDDIQKLKSKIEELQPDVLINNAYKGEPLKTHFHKTNADDFMEDFERNIMPVIALTSSAIKVFRAKKHGKIITILTSYLVNQPPTGTSVYVAGKAYLAQLSKSWATENAQYNITSNTVSPAFMLTGLTKDVDERIIEQMIKSHPLKSLLMPEEVAETVHSLVYASSHLNGIDIVINSGINIK